MLYPHVLYGTCTCIIYMYMYYLHVHDIVIVLFYIIYMYTCHCIIYMNSTCIHVIVLLYMGSLYYLHYLHDDLHVTGAVAVH